MLLAESAMGNVLLVPALTKELLAYESSMGRSDLRLSFRIPWINTMTNTKLVKKEFNLISCSPSYTELSSGTQGRNLKSQAKAETMEE